MLVGGIMKNFFNKGFWKTALRLALPIAVQNMLVSSYALVDTIMVGQLGDATLSAVGMAGQWNWLMNMVVFGICSGASVFFAQFWGVGDKKSIHKAYGIALTSTAAVSLIFFLAAFFAPKYVISIFNRDAEILDVGVRYMKIACFSYLAAAVNTLLCALLRSVERVRLPMYVSLVTTILNAVLDYALIFGKLGLPKMGVEGAALATCISAWSGPLLLLAVSAIQKNMLIAPLGDIFGASASEIKEFFKKASPVIFNEGMWGLGTLCYNIIFANMGYEYYAAVTILKTFENIAYVFFVGMCNACCVMVGKSIGSGNIRRAAEDAKRFSFAVPGLAFIIGMIVVAIRPQLIHIFNLNNNITQKTVDTAMIIMLIYGIHIAVRNIPYVQIVGIFRSGGDTVTGAKYDMTCLWLISLPVTFISAFVLKLPFAVVYALMYICEDYIKSFLCIKYFLSMKWIRPVTESGREGLEAYMSELSAAKG